MSSKVELAHRQRFTHLNQVAVSLQLGGHACEILNWGFLGGRPWRNYLHTHSFYEICYAFEGEGTFRMFGVEYPVREGDVFVAKPHEPHEIVSSTEAPLGIYFWSHTLVSSVSRRDAGASNLDALLRAFSESSCWVSRRAGYAAHARTADRGNRRARTGVPRKHPPSDGEAVDRHGARSD